MVSTATMLTIVANHGSEKGVAPANKNPSFPEPIGPGER